MTYLRIFHIIIPRLYPGSMLGLLFMASKAISAAGMAPDELCPDCPNEVMNMKVRLTEEPSPKPNNRSAIRMFCISFIMSLS